MFETEKHFSVEYNLWPQYCERYSQPQLHKSIIDFYECLKMQLVLVSCKFFCYPLAYLFILT